MKLLKLFLLIAIPFFMVSCLTVGRIERNCDKFAKVCVSEKETVIEYRDTTIYRRDTIRVPLPVRDTVTISDTVRIENNMAWLPPVHKQIGLIGVDAWVTRSILRVDAFLTDSTILHPLLDTIYLDNAIKEEKTTNTVVVEKKHVPKLHKIALAIIVLELLAAVVWLLIKTNLLSRIIKLVKP